MWSNVFGCLILIAAAGILSWILAPEKEEKERKRED